MALKKCKECGGVVSSQAENCPHCGAPVDNDGGSEGPNNNGRKVVIIVLAALIVGGFAWYLIAADKKRKLAEAQRIEQARLDSIAEVERLEAARLDSIREDSIRRNFSTPDLAFFSLKGHVKSVTYSDNDILPFYYATLQKNPTFNFSEDGTLENLPRGAYRSNGRIAGQNITWGEEWEQGKFKFSWANGHVSSSSSQFYEAASDNGYKYDSAGNLIASYYEGGGEGMIFKESATYNYTDFDDNGNWITCKATKISSEGYEDDAAPERTVTHPTITRTIEYW